MKVALVHDYLKEYGGAERVLEALHDIYPQADVFTSVYLPSYLGPHQKRFEKWKIKTSFLQYIPFRQKLISPFRLLSPFAFRSFNFSSYDVVITSATGAYFPNTIKKGSAILICYCHTPPRYLYGYATARNWKNNVIGRIIGEGINHFLRIIDFRASKNVDYYIANSEEVKGRIEKFYRRDATIIYPPVAIQKTQEARNSDKSGMYFLAGGRLARPKHIDLIIDACLALDLPVKIFGKSFAGYGEELKAKIKNQDDSKILFLGEVTDEEKWELMSHAKAYINASEDEDFGILPVEAMGAGTPVIAYRSGGVKETVIDGKTGIFFDELTVSSLAKAIKKFGSISFNQFEIKKQAEKFSKERFEKEIKAFVEKKVKNS